MFEFADVAAKKSQHRSLPDSSDGCQAVLAVARQLSPTTVALQQTILSAFDTHDFQAVDFDVVALNFFLKPSAAVQTDCLADVWFQIHTFVWFQICQDTSGRCHQKERRVWLARGCSLDNPGSNIAVAW